MMRLIRIDPEAFPKALLEERLKAHNVHTNKHAGTFFGQEAFSTEEVRKITVGIASLSEIGLSGGGTLDEIFSHIKTVGLKPCPLNTGLFLRLVWTDQPESENSVLSGQHRAPDRSVTVLSEILDWDDSFPKGLYLRNVDGELWLRAYVCDREYSFAPEDLFAFEVSEDAGETDPDHHA